MCCSTCGINCRCRWIKCFSTNQRSAGLANRTSPHAISRATTEEGPCHSQEGHTGGTTPALQPQGHCVHNTSVTFKASARAQPPSSLIFLLNLRSKCSTATYLSREDRTRTCHCSCVEHTSDRCRQPCEPDDSGCRADRTPTFHAVPCLSWTPSLQKRDMCGVVGCQFMSHYCVTLWHKFSCCVVH